MAAKKNRSRTGSLLDEPTRNGLVLACGVVLAREPDLRSLLAPVSAELRRCAREANDARTRARKEARTLNDFLDSPYAQHMWKSINTVDDLFGVMFVICQTYITYVVSAFKRLHEIVAAEGAALQTTDGSKDALLAHGNALVLNTSHSKVRVLDALANYFKHRDEWPLDWSMASGGAERTIQILEQIGIDRNTPYPLRAGALALGNEHPVRLLAAWRRQLMSDYMDEIEKLPVQSP